MAYDIIKDGSDQLGTGAKGWDDGGRLGIVTNDTVFPFLLVIDTVGLERNRVDTNSAVLKRLGNENLFLTISAADSVGVENSGNCLHWDSRHIRLARLADVSSVGVGIARHVVRMKVLSKLGNM